MTHEEWHSLVVALLKRLGGRVVINPKELIDSRLSLGFVTYEHSDPFKGTVVELLDEDKYNNEPNPRGDPGKSTESD